ncbi:putative basic amino acid antiporter YfcC [Ferrimonas sediminicola]|uniref:Putative basic amino acid antiporter YfcC n=1 Tax=Ferrimonas sediminicola TaxID=2569538 RepID=A0A4U1B8I7_9GAMM|nr:putative basic amino acid antiporter YfcC [Ferrimonas sediminicola]TKB46837.1 putative basic amino acid antiporter YfcC [Ferrimonas sediminicola]
MSRPVAARVPNALVLLSFLAIMAWLATMVVPAGLFEVHQVGNRTLLVEGSFHYADAPLAMPWFSEEGGAGLANVLFEGLVSGSKWGSAIGIIAFLLVIGGAFGIIMATGAMDRAIVSMIHRSARYQDLMLPILFLLFSLGGAVFGMGEEAVAFCVILVPMMVRLGYDSLSAVCCSYVATQVGFGTSWMNPFSVAIAQGIAGVPVLSGAPFRMAIWALFTLTGMLYLYRYGRRIRHNPESSPSYASDHYWRARHQQGETTERMERLDQGIILALVLGLIWVTWGVITRGYYIPQIAAQFMVIGLVIGVIARIGGRLSSMNQLGDEFTKGAAILMPAILVVALAKGIILLLGGDDPAAPSILNTLLHGAGSAFSGLGSEAAAVVMFWFQSAFNLLVSSGSGQAALTMPLMAPLADMLQVSRQVAVLAFQLGDGLTNIIIPTSASLVGCLGVARLAWPLWVGFIWRFTLIVMGLATVVMLIATLVGYQ